MDHGGTGALGRGSGCLRPVRSVRTSRRILIPDGWRGGGYRLPARAITSGGGVPLANLDAPDGTGMLEKPEAGRSVAIVAQPLPTTVWALLDDPVGSASSRVRPHKDPVVTEVRTKSLRDFRAGGLARNRKSFRRSGTVFDTVEEARILFGNGSGEIPENLPGIYGQHLRVSHHYLPAGGPARTSNERGSSCSLR